MERVKIKFIPRYEGVKLPQYATEYSAGMDLFTPCEFTINPGDIRLIKLGFNIELPYDYEMQVRSKSGLSLKHQVVVLNSPGTVDSDYINQEVGVILHNFGTLPVFFEKGKAIAQGVVSKVTYADFEGRIPCEMVRSGGFGHSNK